MRVADHQRGRRLDIIAHHHGSGSGWLGFVLYQRPSRTCPRWLRVRIDFYGLLHYRSLPSVADNRKVERLDRMEWIQESNLLRHPRPKGGSGWAVALPLSATRRRWSYIFSS
jgi:hypothetical protein